MALASLLQLAEVSYFVFIFLAVPTDSHFLHTSRLSAGDRANVALLVDAKRHSFSHAALMREKENLKGPSTKTKQLEWSP